MDVDSVAAELYGLAPDAFVAARDDAEKRARTEGDRELAKQIHQLGKPTVVAWLANQLVRRHADEIGPLLDLGADLREATSSLSGEKLRELNRMQHQVIAGLVAQGRAIAKSAGQRFTEDSVRSLEETLRAALADPDLGEQLKAGRLAGPLQYTGFAGLSDAASAAPKVPSRSPATADKPAKPSVSELRAKAEADVAAAREAAEAAKEARDSARSELDDAAATVRSRQDDLQRLQQELEKATAEHASAVKDHEQARFAQKRAEGIAAKAEDRLERAEAERDRLL